MLGEKHKTFLPRKRIYKKHLSPSELSMGGGEGEL